MKKHLLIPLMLTFCAFKSTAQYNVTGLSGGNVVGSAATSPTSINITNGVTPGGADNVIIGHSTGMSNTGGSNTFVGQATGWLNTTGFANTFLGAYNGQGNTTGIANTFVGQWCGSRNQTGNANVFVGQGAGTGSSASTGNTSGNDNTFIGSGSGEGNTSGNNNTALGRSAGFSSGGLQYATAIGANATCSLANTMVLGGATGSGSAVNVGIGFGAANAPLVHLHTLNVASEEVRFETTNAAPGSNSVVNVKTPSASLKLTMNNVSNSGTLLSSLTTPAVAPAISLTNMATLLSDGNSMAIGKINPENSNGSIHFLSTIATTSGPQVAECMVINKVNGFVGVHTRTAATAGGSGEPQAFFHVNLKNPINSAADNDAYRRIHGIRFEGLPTSEPRHTDVVVIDPATGDLARSSSVGGPGANAWLLTGNSSTAPSAWIGTIDPDDFRIRTANTPRARFTDNGNFELGGNTVLGAATSAAIGTGNNLSALGGATTSTFASGTNNTIRKGVNSLVSGESNTIARTDNAQALGFTNTIDASNGSLASGNENQIKAANYSHAFGSNNVIDQSPGAQASGEGNQVTASSSNSHAMGKQNVIDNSYGALASGDANNVLNASHNSHAFGGSNTIDNSSGAHASGEGNQISVGSSNSSAMGLTNVIEATVGSLASGESNQINSSVNSYTLGKMNYIGQSQFVFATGYINYIDTNSTNSQAMGEKNRIISSNKVAAIGEANTVRNSLYSLVAGEDNTMTGAHGCFIGGGHNLSDGTYNILLGRRLVAESVPTPMTNFVNPFTSTILIGDQIKSHLHNSMTVGFEGNRTTITTHRGLAVQLDPNATVSYTPTVNFEVDAHPTTSINPSPGPQGPCLLRSNIRFHNLPIATDPLPAVVIDPNTGELFRTSSTGYSKSTGNSSEDIDALTKENETLKNRMSELESKLALLEKSISQICETGCAGLNTHLNDELYQSIPNPTNGDVSISYYLSRNYAQASITLINADGKVMRTYTLNPNKGNGSISLSLGELTPGVYLYQLSVEGKQVGAKKIQKQ